MQILITGAIKLLGVSVGGYLISLGGIFYPLAWTHTQRFARGSTDDRNVRSFVHISSTSKASKSLPSIGSPLTRPP